MTIAQISLGLIFFAVITIIWGIVKIHTYPGKIAEARGHPQAQAIEVTSLLGLLIFPLWMAALVWAYSGAVVGTLYAPDDERGAADAEPGRAGGGTTDDAPEAVSDGAGDAAPKTAASGAGDETSGTTPDGAQDDAPTASEGR
ncbi:MAG: DUF3302 domain-containing protein [Acidobacteriota bacterium]|jgi:hypothetical protein